MTDPIAPFVSSLTAPVFALRGVPEEVAAVLFAYYSRSAVGLRDALREMVADGFVPPPGGGTTDDARAKARAFHEKWTVGYGHGSVAEHAVLHVGIEGVSCLAAKAVEDCRLGTAFTEKSTRYVPFTESSAATADEVGIAAHPHARVLADHFDFATRGLMRAYLRAVDAYTDLAPEGTPGQRRAWALDRARQLLPVGTKTSLGLTVNGRALRAMIRKLRADAHPEVRQLAEQLAEVGRAELPGLLKDVPAATLARESANAAVYAHGGDRYIVAGPSVALWLDNDYASTVRASPRTPLPRDFERATLRLDIRCSYAAWRDVQRHRVFSASPVRVDHRSAVELIDAGALPPDVQADILGALHTARCAADHLTTLGAAHLAEYVLPMGTMVRAELAGNLRGLAHFITLRSGKQGHDSYRVIAQALHRQLREAAPIIADAIPCDYEPRDFARK